MGRDNGYILVDLLVGLAIFAIVLGSAQSITRQFLVARARLESEASQRALAMRGVLALSSRIEQARLSAESGRSVEGRSGSLSDWIIPQSNMVVGALTGVSIQENGSGLREMHMFFVDDSGRSVPRLLMSDQDHLSMEILVPEATSYTTSAHRHWLGLQVKFGTNRRNGKSLTSIPVPVPGFFSMFCVARPFEQRCLR